MNLHLRRTISLTLFLMLVVFGVNAQRQVENLGRGVVAINKGSGQVFVSWRLLVTDPSDVAFNLYRLTSGVETKVNTTPLTNATCYSATGVNMAVANQWYVKPVVNGVEQAASGSFTLPANAPVLNYLVINLQPLSHYSVNHVYVGDLDGDGEYDYVVKRVPVDAADNIMIEAYRRDNTFMWRVDLGANIEQGNSAYNPITLVHDFDGDGKAEVMLRSGEGTRFANGQTIGDINSDGISDYRTLPPVSDLRYMLLGDNCPEFISMVDGMTGNEITRTDFIDRGDKANWNTLWGDAYGHRMNMNFTGVAYLDGIRPSIIVSRGDGGNMEIQSFDYTNSQFVSRWTWSARTNAALPANTTWKQFHTNWLNSGAVYSGIPSGYHWADFHNIRVVDLDGDGKDEISFGVNAMDDNGIPLYFAKNDIGHGDRFVVADIDPDRKGLECYSIQQTNSVLAVMYDASNGERIKTWTTASPYDVARGDVADIDPRYKGLELWSYAHSGVLSCKGDQIATGLPHPALSIWWDGDLLRENLDAADGNGYNPVINKWNYSTSSSDRYLSLYNEGGAYSTRSPYAGRVPLYGDILGDWREEIVLNNSDSTELRIFSSTAATNYRIYCLMQNPEYRLCINLKAYLPSTETDFYLGDGMMTPPIPPVLNAHYRWKGGLNGNVWDVNTTANWLTNGVAGTYADGEEVMFDILGKDNNEITLNTDVSPSKILAITPADYSFNGSGHITGSTSLLKSGEGSLTLNVNADYSGTTWVDQGELYVNQTLANSSVKVKWQAVIGGSGTIVQPVTLVSGSIIAPATLGTTGTLNVQNGLTLPTGAVCKFDLSDDPTGLMKINDKLAIVGDLNLTGASSIVINPLNTKLGVGTYVIMTYTGSLVGSLSNFKVSGIYGQKYSLVAGAGIIELVVAETRDAASVVWSGTGNVWDLLTSVNWLKNGEPEVFAPNDTVLFNSVGSAQKVITLTTALPINKMDIDVTSNDYTFSGSGSIGGVAPLTTVGTGKVSLLTKNTYTGKTTINGSVLEANLFDIAGNASSIGATTSTASNMFELIGARLRYSGTTDNNTDRGLTISGTNDTIEVAALGKVLGISGVVAGPAKLVKTGSGTLYLSNNSNTYSGGSIIKAGVLQVNDPNGTIGMLGSGLITLDGGTLTLGSNANNYTTANMNFYIPIGSFGTINTDARCNYYGSLTGGGTLNLYLPGTIDRTIFLGNWLGFTGKISVSCVAAGSRFRLATTNYSGTEMVLANGVTMYHSTGTSGGDVVATAVNIGALSGVSGSSLIDEAWTVGGKNISSVYNGIIKGYSLAKSGTGTLTLTGANTYAGGTSVDGGTLMINNTSGSGTGSASVTVKYGATLGGSGYIKGFLTINSGGYLNPGNGVGTLTDSSNVTLSAGSRLVIEINKTTLQNDKLVLAPGKTLTIGGILQMSILNSAVYAAGDQYKILNSDIITGQFSSIEPATPGSGLIWDTTELYTTGIIKVTAATSIQKTQLESMSFYPNPTNGLVNIQMGETNGNGLLTVEDATGRPVLQKAHNGQISQEVDLTGFDRGIYVIRLVLDDNVLVGKVILK